MKAAGYIFLALLLAILLYLSVERFTVTITGIDSATPPVVTKMDSPIPTSAMSTTAGAAAPVGLTNSAVSLAPPLSAALQPPIPPTPPSVALQPPIPPTPPSQNRLAELEQEEQVAQNEYDRTEALANDAGGAWNALPEGPEKEAASVAYSAAFNRFAAVRVNLERIQNELGNLRR